MPKVSKVTAADRGSVPGMFEYASAEVDGFAVTMQSYEADFDGTFAYKGLPNDQCQASHVGYILKGKLTARLADGSEEMFEAGDAVVLGPGHPPVFAAGSEFVMFTPLVEEKAQAEIVQANMMKYAEEHGIAVPG